MQVKNYPKIIVLAYFLWITEQILIHGNTSTGLTVVPDFCQFWFTNVPWIARTNPAILASMSGSPYTSWYRITKMSLPRCHISTGLACIQFIDQSNHLLPLEIDPSIPKT